MKHVFGIGFTFLLLGVGYYEMSGGADFRPQGMIGAVQASPASQTLAESDIERAESGIPVSAMREFPENVELISASFMPRAPKPVPTEAVPAVAEAAPAIEMRQVSGDWVNLRQGPGTGHAVLDTLPQGTQAKLLESAGGWAKIEIVSTGETGWMSERLLALVES